MLPHRLCFVACLLLPVCAVCRAELAEKQRLKEERLAAAAALKGSKPAGAAAAGSKAAAAGRMPGQVGG